MQVGINNNKPNCLCNRISLARNALVNQIKERLVLRILRGEWVSL